MNEMPFGSQHGELTAEDAARLAVDLEAAQQLWSPVPAHYLSELIEAATDCVVIIDANWRITYLNSSAAREIGSKSSLLGKVLWDLFPEAYGSVFETEYRRAMQERVNVAFEAYYPPLQSWFEIKASPLATDALGIWFSNVSGRRARADALVIAEERYRLAAKATNDLLWDWVLDTNEIRWNEVLEERFGYADPALSTDGDWWLDNVHPDDRQRVITEVEQCHVGKTDRFACEYRFLKADGTYAEIFDRGFVIRTDDGRPVRMVGAMQDYSEKNRLANETAREKAHLASVFGQVMVGIIHCRADGQLLMVNQRFSEILGRSSDEIRNCQFTDYTHPEDIDCNAMVWEEAFLSGQPFQIEKRYLRPDGSSVWCEVSVSFVLNAERRVESFIVVAQDISDRKSAEQALSRQIALLQNVVDSVSDLIFIKDHTGRFVLANRALDEAFGNLLGLRTTEVPLLSGNYDTLDQEVMDAGKSHSVEETIPVDGESRLFQTVKVPWIEQGEILGVIGVSRDITERKSAEEALRRSELLYRSVLEGSPDSVVIMSPDGLIELINTAGLQTARSSLDTLKNRDWASCWPEPSFNLVRAAVVRAREGSLAHFTESYTDQRGETVWFDVLVSPVRDEHGTVTRLLAIARDVTNQRETADKLKWASEHDPLTELPNRRAFEARLQAAAISAMETGKGIGLLLLDLDHFKHINDTLGHAAGDHLLNEVGKNLRASIREVDFVARLGGDEFAVILTDIEGQEALLRAGDAIAVRLQDPMEFSGRLMSAGLSIGGALFPADAESANQLFNNADTALYAMKTGGRGGIKMFQEHMREQAYAAANQLSLARAAISKDLVVPHYQQKVDLQTGEIAGFEALLRWRHPELGIQPPDSVAEGFKDYEISSRFGEVMQTAILRNVREWLDASLPIGSVAINAAPSEFLRDDYAERFLARMDKFGVPPQIMQVEVTEHVFLERGSEFVARALKLLNSAGVQIALDDFGTGYSSLSHLRDFPVDVVKVDQSFIQKMGDDPDINAIVNAVIGLARSLKITVVAEGIETQAQLSMLRGKGCEIGQGFLFGRAVAAKDIPYLLTSGNLVSLQNTLRNVA